VGPLLSEFASDPEMLELVEMFVAQLPGRVEAIRKSVDQIDMAMLAQLAHQLKGAGGGYGFPSITETAGAVEKLAKAQATVDELRKPVDELISLCTRASGRVR
jgi:HPt (histidine-containing phosphotransfer) domain-containing protein